MTSLSKIFVYGTLKRVEKNHHILSSKENGFSEFQAEGKTVQKYPLVVGKFELCFVTFYNKNLIHFIFSTMFVYFLKTESHSDIPFVINRPGTGKVVG